jgi:hypothetical protein
LPSRSIAAALLAVLWLLLPAVGAALAVQTGEWVHETESDFQAAELDHTVVTNLGRIELSRASEQLAELDSGEGMVNDALVLQGRTYLALGPEGRLAELSEQREIKILAEFEAEQVFALDRDETGLWLAISGADSRLERRTADGEVDRTIALPGVRYVWDLIVTDDRLWVATGTNGRLLMVDRAGEEPKVYAAYDSEQNNLLCLAMDGQGRVYAGSDGEGLVYRIERTDEPLGEPLEAEPAEEAAADDAAEAEDETDGENGEAAEATAEEGEPETEAAEDDQLAAGPGMGFAVFVAYDAAEPEIGALLAGSDGVIYAGTADAEQARPGRLKEAIEEEIGVPEPATTEVRDGEPAPPLPDEPSPEPRGAADAPAAEGDADEPVAREQGAAERAEPGVPGDGAVEAGGRPAAEDAPPAAPEPTPQQYEQVRRYIQQRLAEARAGRPMRMQAGTGDGNSRQLSPRRPTGGQQRTAQQQQQQRKEGNAVYAIEPDGFVREIFRESIMVLRLLEQDGQLIIATGNEGQVYRVDPNEQETTVIADLEVQQVPAMTLVDGRIVVGTANPGQLVRLGAGYADRGTFTSDPLDAGQISRFGNLAVLAMLPEGAGVAVQTRSGNVGDADLGLWSEWSAPATIRPEFAGQPVFHVVASPSARFLQYRLILESEGERTPAVDRVAIKYLTPNMRPQISSVSAEYGNGNGEGGEAPTPQTTINVEWEASDPNGDTLQYALEFRRLSQPGDEHPWLPLEDEIDQTRYEWDTRTVPDGRYELRLIASDAPDNVDGEALEARRLTSQLVIDNRQPEIVDFAVEPGDPGALRVELAAEDGLTPITDIRYSVDGAEPWQAVLPADRIYDSTSERAAFTITDLSPGLHVVSVRVIDSQGNAHYVSRTAEVAAP